MSAVPATAGLEVCLMKVVLFLEILVVMLGCTGPKPLQQKDHEESEMTASNLVRRVVSTLAGRGRSGSLAYEGVCTSNEGITDSFRVGSTEPADSPVQALRHAFANERRLSVKEDASGRIRVVGGNLHTDLLDLRISQISFHSEENPRDAMANLVTLPQVKAYMQSHRIHFVNAMNGLAPMPKGAHLMTTLKNITVYEGLDRIAQTFPGVWIYGECTDTSGERLIDFTFIEF